MRFYIKIDMKGTISFLLDLNLRVWHWSKKVGRDPITSRRLEGQSSVYIIFYKPLAEYSFLYSNGRGMLRTVYCTFWTYRWTSGALWLYVSEQVIYKICSFWNINGQRSILIWVFPPESESPRKQSV